MILEALTVCVDYADFLTETLPLNRPQVDRMVVVTSPEDHATQQVCDFWDVDVVLTDALGSRWGDWHKARGINAGLSVLNWSGWVLHIDADIAMPPRSRVLMERASLDKQCLYGVDRLCVPNYAAWRDHQAMPHIQTDGYHVRLGGAFSMVPRFNGWHVHGYAPVGYWQLWHPHEAGVREYPANHNGGDRTDVLFAEKWPREQRVLIPEFAVYHLESEPHAQGANWGGRTTARFGPEPSRSPNDYSHRRHTHHRHHHHRHHHHHYYEHDNDSQT